MTPDAPDSENHYEPVTPGDLIRGLDNDSRTVIDVVISRDSRYSVRVRAKRRSGYVSNPCAMCVHAARLCWRSDER